MSLVPYRPAPPMSDRQIPLGGCATTEIAVFDSARADDLQYIRDADGLLLAPLVLSYRPV